MASGQAVAGLPQTEGKLGTPEGQLQAKEGPLPSFTSHPTPSPKACVSRGQRDCSEQVSQAGQVSPRDMPVSAESRGPDAGGRAQLGKCHRAPGKPSASQQAGPSRSLAE